MVLRPLEPAPASQDQQQFTPAWPVVERLQRERYQSCWMITQPSHAALAGEIAAKLGAPQVPPLEPELIRAIALHDAGWGMPDAQAVMHSRAGQLVSPRSFLQCSVAEFLTAWTQSIETALSTSPAGGYTASRHFWRIAAWRMETADDTVADRDKLQGFLDFEAQRQKKLTGRQQRSIQELERLTDVLQFCDLLSLFICCGARENVEFPEYFGVKARLRVEDAGYRLEPTLVESGSEFAVAALRHPATKAVSAQEMKFRIL